MILGGASVFGSGARAIDPTAEAAQLLALGAPTGEPAGPATSEGPFDTLLFRHAQVLASNPAAAAEVAERAFLDAFGMASTAKGAPRGARIPEGALYHAALEAQLAWLSQNPEAYVAVLQRAYTWTIHRDPYEEELAYWRERPTLSYVLLVGCLEDWGRRNQPGLMVTAGTATISVNCPDLTTLKLSPELAAEVRTALHRAPPANEAWSILAPGADEVVSSGAIPFVAVGSAALRAAAGPAY